MKKNINPRVAKILDMESSQANEVLDSVTFRKDSLDVLLEAKACYEGLEEARSNRRRNRRYVFADDLGQWSDLMEGLNITEAENISNQGKTPLQYNIILSTVQTILGLFRGNQTEPVCVARDRQEQKLGEMMSVAIQYGYQLNDVWELDANNLLEMLLSGVCINKTTYGWIPALQRCDVREENKNLPRMFFNPMEDVRAWDCTIIGELHDMTKADIVTAFSNGSEQRAKELLAIYKTNYTSYSGGMLNNMTARNADSINFYNTSTSDKCRVIEVWKLESKAKYWCHDTLEGKSFWLPLKEKNNIIAINRMRTEEAAKYGIAPKLIAYKWGTHQYWYYRFFSPTGEVLKEGETPYLHGSHPYTIRTLLNFDGKPHAFVNSAIDAQRMLNRNLTLIDFIIGASSKGTLMIAKGSVPEGVTADDWGVEYRKVGGIITYVPNPSLPNGGVPFEVSSSAKVAGISDMVGMVMSLFPDLTGVHGALQGKTASSGVSGKLYETEANNASSNLIDTFESFKSHRTERDKKMMYIIQQYWDSPRFIDIAGKQFSNESKWYEPEKVRDADFDLTLSESTASINYRTTSEQMLQIMWEKGAITVENWLSNSSMPFADKVLQTINNEREQMAKQGQLPQQGQQAQMAQPQPNMQMQA